MTKIPHSNGQTIGMIEKSLCTNEKLDVFGIAGYDEKVFFSYTDEGLD